MNSQIEKYNVSSVHIVSYYVLSALTLVYVRNYFELNEAKVIQFLLVYAVFCSSFYIIIPRPRPFLKYIGLEIVIVTTWVLFLRLTTLDFTEDSSMLFYVLGMKFIFAILLVVPIRFVAFVFLEYGLKIFGKYKFTIARTLAVITFAASIYSGFYNLTVEKIRRNKNFVNSRQHNNLYETLKKAKTLQKQKCFDRLYEGASITFIEDMLILPHVSYPDSSSKLKRLRATSAYKPPSQQFETITTDLPFYVSRCFYLNDKKFYTLRATNEEYAISEEDLDFAGKNLITVQQLLYEKLQADDLAAFTSVMESRRPSDAIILSEVIQKIVEIDQAKYFEEVYKVAGDLALKLALSKSQYGSNIFTFSLLKPINTEVASEALMVKIMSGSGAEVKKLLEKGATFRYDSGNHELMILRVSLNEKHFNEIMEIYLQHGGDINVKSSKGETIFLRANTAAQIDYLLSKGALINDTDDEGRTLLHYLAQFRNDPKAKEAMKLLIERGIDKQKKNVDRLTAYDLFQVAKSCMHNKNQCKEYEFLK